MNNIRILLYEDKLSTRESLKELFEYESDFILAGAFSDCRRIEQQVEELLPDLILMDKDMPGVDGLEGLILVKSKFPDIEVVMHTGLDDDETIFTCLQSGASGYIKKGLPYMQLLEYLRVINRGGTMFSPSIAGKVRDFFLHGPPQKVNKYSLTPKESEALGLLCEGLSQKLIASKMSISVNGVAAHLKNIFRKLQVNSAPEAVSKAIRHRLIDREKLKFE